MSYPIKKPQKKYTYKDYLRLPVDHSYEIIEGTLYAMVPAPSIQHQRVSGNLFIQIANYLKDKNNCSVFYAPLDVLLPEENEEIETTKTIVQPDIFIVCDKNKITEKYCIGPPDLILEIVSPSSPSRDYVKKLHLYEKHKVREYWIVNYLNKEIMVYKLHDNGEYDIPQTYQSDYKIKVGIFEDLTINLKDVFG